MQTIRLEQLGAATKDKRGNRGIREIAKEIGISPATLSRIETGKQPDLDTFTKICRWLEVNPAEVLSVTGKNDEQMFAQNAYVQFRAEKTMNSETAKRLGEMILAVQNMLSNE